MSEPRPTTASLVSPDRDLTHDDLRTCVEVGGYVHPLFNDPAQQAPFPGQALLLFCGGLVEQTQGLPDDIIALVELSRVRFLQMVKPPATVRVRVDLHPREATSRPDRVLCPMTWTLLSDAGEHLQAEVVMLGRSAIDP